MPQQNMRKSSAQCEVIMEHPYEQLRIDYNSECCRVSDLQAFIKAECFSPKGNHKFRVRIEIESVADDEVSRPEEPIAYTEYGIADYDPDCILCREMSKHFSHFYNGTTKQDVDTVKDYASCQHIWEITRDGKYICRNCRNIKMTRRKPEMDAESYYNK